MAFRAFIFFSLTFRAVSRTWRSESLSLLSYGVQGLHLFQFGVQSRIFSLAFRSTISFSVWRSELHLQLGVQSHHPFSIMAFRAFIFFSLAFRVASPTWHSESLSLLNYGIQGLYLLQFGVQRRIFSLAFRATIFFQFGVQNRISSLAFRVTIPSQLWCSRPTSSSIWCSKSHLQFGIQSRHIFSVWPSEPCFQFGVQSHHPFSVRVFRAASPVQRSESLSFHSLAFRAIILSQLGICCHLFDIQGYIPSIQNHHFLTPWHSEPSSHYNLAFRATISSHFGHSKPPSFFSLAFRAAIPSQLWYSEPPYLLRYNVQSRPSQFGVQSLCFCLAFITIVLAWHSEPSHHLFIGFGIQSHHLLTAWSPEPPSHYSLTFRATISSQFGV